MLFLNQVKKLIKIKIVKLVIKNNGRGLEFALMKNYNKILY